MPWAQSMKSLLSLRRGVAPPANKNTASSSIEPGPGPEIVIIPLQQHIGPPCDPLVKAGERVLLGQKIGDSGAYVSAPVHASVSGEVTAVREHPHPTGQDVLSVFIKSDGKDEMSPEVRPPGDPMEMSPEQIRVRIREGGVVGLGGAAFPTHVKLSPPRDKPIELVIINGAECEPYLTADHRLMVERSADIIKGSLIIKRAVGAQKVIAAIEENKPDAIESMSEAGREYGIEVFELPSRYPQGAEKTLIDTVTGREVPRGGLPMEVGVIVDNVGTAAAIQDVFHRGVPLVERVVTVSGDGVARGANLRVKIGTTFADVIDFCGGFTGQRGKLIMGGPMMGLAQYTAEVPVIKATSGILALRGETLFKDEPAHFTCIRCGRCVRQCPMDLMPYILGSYSDAGMWTQLEDFYVDDCNECGCCAYICPTKNPLVQLIKVGKEGVARRRQKMESFEEATSKRK